VTFSPDVADGRHTVQQGWLFGQDELTPVSGLTFTFGLRVDLHSETDASWSPRAAAVWEPIEDHFFRASAGRGFRNPTLRELWFDMPVTGVPGVPAPITIAGNLDLKPESLTSFEIGYFGSWGPDVDVERSTLVAVDPMRGNHQFEAGVSIFYNLVDDLIDFQSDPNNQLRVLPMNQDDEEAYGFELEGRYVFSDYFSAFGNYSFVIRRDRDTDEENELAPRNVVNAGIAGTGFGFNSMLWVNYYDQTQLFGIDIDSYVLVNGSVSYAFPVSDRATGQAFLRFFNVLDDVHREHPQGDDYGLIISGGLQLDW